MRVNEDRINKVQDLMAKAVVSSQSINWWEKQVYDLITKIEELEQQSGKEEEIKNLLNQLGSLARRGDMELLAINKLEEEVTKFLENEKKQQKKSGKKKP
jgi:hypothetical protein